MTKKTRRMIRRMEPQTPMSASSDGDPRGYLTECLLVNTFELLDAGSVDFNSLIHWINYFLSYCCSLSTQNKTKELRMEIRKSRFESKKFVKIQPGLRKLKKKSINTLARDLITFDFNLIRMTKSYWTTFCDAMKLLIELSKLLLHLTRDQTADVHYNVASLHWNASN